MALNIVPTVKRGWNPGQSGNPGGRARERTLQELCRAQTEEAVKTLIVCMRNPKERLPAAIAILDRAWGKPKQVIEAEGSGMSDLALHLLAAQLVSQEIIQRQAELANLPTQPTTIDGTVSTNVLDAPLPTE